MTARRTSMLALVGALGLGPLTGCGSAAAPTAAAPAEIAGSVGADEPSSAPTPATAAGPLTKDQLPPASTLGPRWTEYSEPGGGESAVVGNASSTQGREVNELMEGLTPIGCPQDAVDIALPSPTYALEGTYRGPAGAPGVSLVLQFANAATARTFLARFGDQVDACPAPSVAPPDDDPPALGFRRLSTPATIVAALRSETGLDADPNRYLVVAVGAGDRIGLAYVGGAKPADRTRVAKGLAASIAH